jgi:hypothetical protein
MYQSLFAMKEIKSDFGAIHVFESEIRLAHVSLAGDRPASPRE